MRTIEVRRTLRAPVEKIFEVLVDHAGYARFPGVKSAKVVRPGIDEQNGLGAIREIDLGTAWFQEEIVVFQRPSRFDYKILRSRPPIRHERGTLTFKSVEDGVEVLWVSTFAVDIPLIGGILTAVAARNMSRVFFNCLGVVEERALEA